MISNLPPRQRLLAIIAGVVVALLVLDSVVIEPLYHTWQTHAAEITRLNASVTKGRTTIARAAQNDRRWSDMQANALAKEPSQAEGDVYSAFDRWAVANRVELSGIRFQWKRGATDKYSLLEGRIDATGTMTTLSHFLYELEQSALALRVDSVEVTSRDDSGQKLGLSLIVSGLRLTPLERKLQ